MNRTIVVLLAAMFVGRAGAADYGIGISAKSDNSLLYFPIDLSSKLRIEPHLRYLSSESTQESDFGGEPVMFRSESDALEIGVGVFGLAVPKESVRLYYGMRAGYFDGDSRSSSATVQNEQSYYGYRIVPTIGFEYQFNRHFTLGGEVGYAYEDHHIVTRGGSIDSETDFDRGGTDTFLILRYFF